MKTLGENSPVVGDYVSITISNGKTINGTIINWGAEAWDQYWATIKTASGGQVQVNIAKIDSYSIEKTADVQYQLIKKETKETGEIVKTALPLGKEVKDPDLKKVKLSGNPIQRAQQLVDLYNERSKLTKKEVSDHLNRKDLVEVDENYAMPSFKKRP